MLVFISGSINSGKTTTSKALAAKLGADFINVDDLNDLIPNFNLATDLDKLMDLAIKTINERLDQGRSVVANYVVRQKDFNRFEKEIHTDSQYVITLAPRLEVAQSQRGQRELTEWEIERIKYHYDTGITSPRFGHVIDNSDLNVDKTIERMLEIIHGDKIKPVSEADHPMLLAIQSDAIMGLTAIYPPEQLAKWVDYIQAESSDRYARYKNLGYWDDGELRGFVSWSVDGDDASVECLYVSEPYRDRGIGGALLRSAEEQLRAKSIHVRSTLNARSFYENQGYVFQKSDISRAGFAIACLVKAT